MRESSSRGWAPFRGGEGCFGEGQGGADARIRGEGGGLVFVLCFRRHLVGSWGGGITLGDEQHARVHVGKLPAG